MLQVWFGRKEKFKYCTAECSVHVYGQLLCSQMSKMTITNRSRPQELIVKVFDIPSVELTYFVQWFIIVLGTIYKGPEGGCFSV